MRAGPGPRASGARGSGAGLEEEDAGGGDEEEEEEEDDEDAVEEVRVAPEGEEDDSALVLGEVSCEVGCGCC